MKKMYIRKLPVFVLAAVAAIVLLMAGTKAEAEGQEAVAVPALMDDSSELYGSLSRFLGLSAERFQIYTVAIIDPVSQKPVQADQAVPVNVEAPADYHVDRIVVSEISMSGQTPVRTEIACTWENGQVTFFTDHTGIYAVMEKKKQTELPDSLEMTPKVDKLELVPRYPDGIPSPAASASSSSAPSAPDAVSGGTDASGRQPSEAPMPGPQTGDNNFAVMWESLMIISFAAAALVALKVKKK